MEIDELYTKLEITLLPPALFQSTIYRWLDMLLSFEIEISKIDVIPLLKKK